MRAEPRTQPQSQMHLFAAPAAADAAAANIVTVGDTVFTHGIDDKSEWFEHEDARTGLLWSIRRHTDERAHPTVREVFRAYVATPGEPGSAVLINGMMTREGEVLRKGALADAKDRDARSLLEAMRPLIRRGEVPHDLPRDHITVYTNGNPKNFMPDPLDALFERLEALTLDPACEVTDKFFSIMPNGDARAAGRFLEAPLHFTVYGPPEQMEELRLAIERARNSERYKESLTAN